MSPFQFAIGCSACVFRHASYWRFEFDVIDRRFSFEPPTYRSPFLFTTQFAPSLCYLILFPTPSSALNASRKCPNCQMPKSKMWLPLSCEETRDPGCRSRMQLEMELEARFRYLPMTLLTSGHMSPLAQFQSKPWPQATWQSKLIVVESSSPVPFPIPIPIPFPIPVTVQIISMIKVQVQCTLLSESITPKTTPCIKY